jgi:hypothetical protein
MMYEQVLTVTQLKMLEVLSDGRPHQKTELHACLSDDLAQMSALTPHLVAIRKMLRLQGEEVVCEFINRQRLYRHVRLLPSACDGYR